MNNSIQTYSQLLEEKQRLQTLINAQKELVRYDIQELKKELKPVGVAFSFLKNITSRSGKNSLLNYGVDVIVDLLFKKIILSNAGWVTRLTLPFLLRNYSSNVIADNKKNLVQKLSNWFKSRMNGKTTEESKQY